MSLSPTEQVRAAALGDIAAAIGAPATPLPTEDAVVAYERPRPAYGPGWASA